jgi:hypothetical protein
LEYQEAFKAHQDPALLYNAAQAHRLAGDSPKALLLYNNVIRLYPDSPYAAQSRARIAEMSQSTAAAPESSVQPVRRPSADLPPTTISLEPPAERNPKYNSILNPEYNSIINPKYNSVLNPEYNSVINPKYNSVLNPEYNSVINPKFNSALNPKYNTALNPEINRSVVSDRSRFAAYIFELDASFAGVLVAASADCWVLVSPQGTWAGEAIPDGDKGMNLFRPDGEWRGYLRSNEDSGFNVFDTQGHWIGFAVRSAEN